MVNRLRFYAICIPVHANGEGSVGSSPGSGTAALNTGVGSTYQPCLPKPPSQN